MSICDMAGDGFVDLKAWRGLDWRLSTKTLGQFAEIEKFILGRRGDPLATVLAWVRELPPELRADVAVARQVEASMRLHTKARFASQEEIWEYNNSPAGMGHRLWMACRESHPDKTLEICTEHVLRASLDEIDQLSAAIDGSDQKDQLKNCDGPDQNGARE